MTAAARRHFCVPRTDAGALVREALRWKTVPAQHVCETRVEAPEMRLARSTGMRVNLSLITDGCDNTLNKVRFLEHVQCKITLTYLPRGQLRIKLRRVKSSALKGF